MPPKRATTPVEQREAQKHPASSQNDHKPPPFPSYSDDDSVSSFPPQSNLGRHEKSRDGARDSPSSASTNGRGEGSLYSTPGTSAAVTPAPGFNPVKRRGRSGTTNLESTLAVNPVARAAALRDSQFNLNSSKRKRVADSEEDEDLDEDESPDAQLARALQDQEDAAANSMGMDIDDTDASMSRRTPRQGSRKILPKTSYVLDSDADEDDEDSPDFTRRSSKRPKIELGAKGSNAITFTDKGKGKAKTAWAGGLLGDEMGMGKTIQAVTLIMSDFPAKQPSLVLIPPVAIMQWQSEIKDYTDGTLKTFADHKWCLSGTPLQNRIGELFSLVRFLEIRPFAGYVCKACPCSPMNWTMQGGRCTGCHHGSSQHVSVFNQELLIPIQKFGSKGRGAEAFRKLGLLTGRFMLRRVKRDHAAAMELPAKEIYVDRQFFGEEENDFAGSIMNQGTRKFETYVAQGVLLNNYANIFGLIMHMRQVADHPDLILKRNGEGGKAKVVPDSEDEDSGDENFEGSDDFLEMDDSDQDSEADIPLSTRRKRVAPASKAPRQPAGGSDASDDATAVAGPSARPRARAPRSGAAARGTIDRPDDGNSSADGATKRGRRRRKERKRLESHHPELATMWDDLENLPQAGEKPIEQPAKISRELKPFQLQGRQASINHFKTDIKVECFLVSLKAGGVALNLTEASKVFLVDPWWNPAAEWQSADRCHRIGQGRPCQITRLCIEDSVESRMVLLQEKKANMINSTINADQKAMENLTPQDLQFLFRGS
ncbi:hypothetical protein BUE80_DR007756 [Diplocarpon rosae]|nr:hypothetical protein BUE80_DR007756 [Diplocarpon rosae]